MEKKVFISEGAPGWTRRLEHGDHVLLRNHVGNWSMQTVECNNNGIVDILYHDAHGDCCAKHRFDENGVELNRFFRPYRTYGSMCIAPTTPGNMHRFQKYRHRLGDPNWNKYAAGNSNTKQVYVLIHTSMPRGGGLNGNKQHMKVLHTSSDRAHLHRILLEKLRNRMNEVGVDGINLTDNSKPIPLPKSLTLFPITENGALAGFTFHRTISVPNFPDIIEMDSYQIAACKGYLPAAEQRTPNMPTTFAEASEAITRNMGKTHVIGFDAFFPYPFRQDCDEISCDWTHWAKGTPDTDRYTAIWRSIMDLDMEYCEYTIRGKSGAISRDNLEKMLTARFGMKELTIEVVRPLNPYDFPDKEVPGLAISCEDEISYWDDLDFSNTKGIKTVCDTDNVRELAVKVYGVFREEMGMDKAVDSTHHLIKNSRAGAWQFISDTDGGEVEEVSDKRVTLGSLVKRLARIQENQIMHFRVGQKCFAACLCELFRVKTLIIGCIGQGEPLILPYKPKSLREKFIHDKVEEMLQAYFEKNAGATTEILVSTVLTTLSYHQLPAAYSYLQWPYNFPFGAEILRHDRDDDNTGHDK